MTNATMKATFVLAPTKSAVALETDHILPLKRLYAGTRLEMETSPSCSREIGHKDDFASWVKHALGHMRGTAQDWGKPCWQH